MAWGQTQYRNAGVIGGHEEQRIPKIEIEGDNASLLGRADRYQFRICRPTKTLCRYRSHLVPRLTQKLSPTPAKVLVQFESHPCVSRGISK